MTTKTGVSLEEYLRTGFADLDCEYVDGEIVERSVPEIDHGRTQTNLAFRFKGFERKFHRD